MNRERGFVLISVLLVVSLLTVMVVDIAARAGTYASVVSNYADTEALSSIVKSGYLLASKKAVDVINAAGFIPKKEFEFTEDVEGYDIRLFVTDNGSKLNLNKLVHGGGLHNEQYKLIFKRLLKQLELPEDIAERVADFIDPDSDPTVSGSEDSAKNYPLFYISELRYVIDEDAYMKLLPFVTVFGNGIINVNTAPAEIFKALDDRFTDTIVNAITARRRGEPFTSRENFRAGAGIDNALFQAVSDKIDVKSNSFDVKIEAAAKGMSITADAAFEVSGDKLVTKYWKER